MRSDEGIQNGIQQLARVFSENPHIFLTEADVQCYLYSILLQNDYYGKSGKATASGSYEKIKNKNRNTLRLHAEILSNSRQEFCDLSVINLRDIKLPARIPRDIISAHYEEDLLHTYKYNVDLSEATGIEIKFNWGYYTRAQCRNKRLEMASWIKSDLKKLMKDYKHRYFIFVDKAHVFLDEQEFASFIRNDCKFVNWKHYTAYYLYPKMRRKIRIRPLSVGPRY